MEEYCKWHGIPVFIKDEFIKPLERLRKEEEWSKPDLVSYAVDRYKKARDTLRSETGKKYESEDLEFIMEVVEEGSYPLENKEDALSYIVNLYGRVRKVLSQVV